MRKNVLFLVLAVLVLFASCAEPHVHVFDKDVASEKYLASSATEKTAATYYKSCECGEKGNETFEYGEPLHKHTFNGAEECTECGYISSVSVWTGNVYEYETTYEEGSSKGFVVLTNSDLDSSAALAKEGVLENAKKFVSWFSGEFLDTKKLTIIEEKIIDNEAPLGGKSHAQVTVSSADGLIVLPLIKDYFYALSLIECDKTGNKGGVNAYYYMAKGFDVVVDKDIDFANKNRIPMQKGIGASIDFKGHTVKNIKSVSDEEGILLGLFGNVNSVSNLVIENAYVEGTGNGSSVGALMGYSDNGKLENVTIKDSLIKGSKYTGGIAGKSYSDITNCKVENCDISTTSKEVGGLVGIYCDGTLSGSTVANCTITAKGTEAGGLVGRVFEEASPSVVGNTVEGTAVKISGEVAKADIGSAENYLGRVCGRVLDSSANDKTQPETIISDNIVK